MRCALLLLFTSHSVIQTSSFRIAVQRSETQVKTACSLPSCVCKRQLLPAAEHLCWDMMNQHSPNLPIAGLAAGELSGGLRHGECRSYRGGDRRGRGQIGPKAPTSAPSHISPDERPNHRL